MEKIEEKIGYHINLKEISQELCENYQLGKYKEYALINTGLEDLNYCLVTEKGKKYLIKIFNKNRSQEQLIDYIEKHKILEKNKIETPRIIQVHEEEIFIIIMEYIEGKDLYASNESITQQQVEDLIKKMKKIHQIPNKIACIYDEYHINNFNKSYDLCISYLNETLKNIGENLKEEYNKIDFSKMPKCFIHGDFHKGNIMKDLENNLYLVDFSSCGYSYRMIDVVDFINNTLFDYREIELSKKRIDYFLKHFELSNYEKEIIKC